MSRVCWDDLMPGMRDLIEDGHRTGAHGAWVSAVVDERAWRIAAAGIAEGRWRLLALWGETGAISMAILDEEPRQFAVLTLGCPEARFPSVARNYPAAIRLERAIQDLFGLQPEGMPDGRPWLDHGRWGIRHPLGDAEESTDRRPYEFLTAEGESLHQIPVGPVHAGIIEPGHFRFTANGETIVRLEERLGYTHKGVDALMTGADLASACRLAGRVSGDSTVAYALAFCQAAEAALGHTVPKRAEWLRALMAELERLANHLGDIGAICNDAAFALIHAHCATLRERVLRVAALAFGHRLMMDRIVPGGVLCDLTAQAAAEIRTLRKSLAEQFPALVDLYDNTASLQDRTVGTGILRPELARAFGAGGYIGRASGRSFDARRVPGYAPYDMLAFDVPVRSEGDVNARVWIRIREVEQSLALVDQILDRLPAGPVFENVPAGGGQGAALVEGFRGDIFAWVRVGADGRILRCHLRDPSWFQWPLLEQAIEDNIVADFPLCNKSFNCSYSGHDI